MLASALVRVQQFNSIVGFVCFLCRVSLIRSRGFSLRLAQTDGYKSPKKRKKEKKTTNLLCHNRLTVVTQRTCWGQHNPAHRKTTFWRDELSLPSVRGSLAQWSCPRCWIYCSWPTGPHCAALKHTPQRPWADGWRRQTDGCWKTKQTDRQTDGYIDTRKGETETQRAFVANMQSCWGEGTERRKGQKNMTLTDKALIFTQQHVRAPANTISVSELHAVCGL